MTEYAEGYGEEELLPDETKIAEAVQTAQNCDYAVVFAGLPDSKESEGYDRADMKMPASHVALIEAVAAVNPNTVVVLMCGSPVELSWRNQVKGILLMYLGGEAVGSACANLLSGKANPGGKLAETWPEKLQDVASSRWFAKNTFLSEYRERMFVGYRWFDSAKRTPAYPFGYGLSYTSFALENIHMTGRKVKLTVRNTGKHAGSEVVQVYVGKYDSNVLRVEKELKAFAKVYLQPGESKEVCLELDDRALSFYDVRSHRWVMEIGVYDVFVGTSSRDLVRDILLDMDAEGEVVEREEIPDCYAKLPFAGPLKVEAGAFEQLFPEGYPVQPRQLMPFHRNSVMGDLQASGLGKLVLKIAGKVSGNVASDGTEDMLNNGMYEFPFRAIPMSGVLSHTQVNGFIDILNGNYASGVKKLVKK